MATVFLLENQALHMDILHGSWFLVAHVAVAIANSEGQQVYLCTLLMSQLVLSVSSCSSPKKEIFVGCRNYSIKVSERNCATGDELKLIQCQEMHQHWTRLSSCSSGLWKGKGLWSLVCVGEYCLLAKDIADQVWVLGLRQPSPS